MARDASGTYTRISNSFSSPTSQTVISPTDAETFFDEVETEITDSLSRSGKGGMSATAVLKIADGTSAAPALSFNLDTDTGIARTTANTMIVAASGVAVITFQPTMTTIPNLTVSSSLAVTGGVTNATLATTGAYTLKGNTTGSTAAPTDFKISSLTDRAGFGAGDKLMIEESTGELRKVDYNDFPGAGSLGGSTGGTDNAALRADGTSGGTVQSSALVIADTTGAISRSGNGGIPVQGTNTNDSASAGDVGQIIEATTTEGSPVSLTTATSVDIASLSLTAGDWDVWGNVYVVPAGTLTAVNAWAGTTVSNTAPTRPNAGGQTLLQGISAVASAVGVAAGQRRISVSGTTTVYMGVNATFTSTATAFGYFGARRRR